MGQHVTIQMDLSELDEEGKLILEPEAILEVHTKKLRPRDIIKYLIKWKKLPSEDATWEDEQFVQQHPDLTKL